MTSKRCREEECRYEEPHRHGFACTPGCPCGQAMKGRRTKRCQHCYRGVRLMPAEEPGAPDRPVDDRGEFECLPGLAHKLMPAVTS